MTTHHTARILAAAQARKDAETKSAAAYRRANARLTTAAAAYRRANARLTTAAAAYRRANARLTTAAAKALQDGVAGWRIQQLLEERGLR